MNIPAAGNVEVPAYLALRDKGYAVRVKREGLDAETWVAAKGGNRFSAARPIELLGVVAVFETCGESWKATDNEIDDFVKRYGI